MKFIKLLLLVALTLGSLIVQPFSQTALADTKTVIISEVSMGSTTSATDEFVELFNNSDKDVTIGGWTLSYKSAIGETWTKKATINAGKVLTPHSYYLLATQIPADTKMTSGLAQGGGNLRLADSSGAVQDQFAWGNGDSPLGKAVGACRPGESLYRLPLAGSPLLASSDNNNDDFDVTPKPTPGSANILPAVTSGAEASAAESQNGINLQLTELLPDPAKPLTDSNNEFIELYNPNDSSVNLKGWTIEDASHKAYTFPNAVIEARGYLAVYSRQSKIGLNNNGDVVSLLNPAGQEIDKSLNYGKAKTGLSWGLVGGNWVWTITPTPGAPNAAALTSANEPGPDATTSSAKHPGKKTGRLTEQLASSKGKKGKGAVTNPKTQTANKLIDEATKPASARFWSWLLIGLGLATIGYGVYEYKPEIKSYYHRAKAKFRPRPKAGKAH